MLQQLAQSQDTTPHFTHCVSGLTSVCCTQTRYYFSNFSFVDRFVNSVPIFYCILWNFILSQAFTVYTLSIRSFFILAVYFVIFCRVFNMHTAVQVYSVWNIVVSNFPTRRALALQSSGSQVIDNPFSWTGIGVTIITTNFTIVAIAIGFRLDGQKNFREI